jgi:transposase
MRTGYESKGQDSRGIHLLPSPSHSPELQPAERLWPIVDEPIANRTFATLDELEEAVVQRCQMLLQQKELIRGLTNFHWWTQIESRCS